MTSLGAELSFTSAHSAARLWLEFTKAVEDRPVLAWPRTVLHLTRQIEVLRPDAGATMLLLACVTELLQRRSGDRLLPSLTLISDRLAIESRLPDVLRRFETEVVAWLARRVSQMSLDAARAHSVARFVDAHLQEPLQLNRMATIFGCSGSVLARLFRQVFGVTPRAYVVRSRILKATDLLGDGEKVEAVMLSVGYHNKTSFYREFMRLTGMTPGEYRLKIRSCRAAPAPPAFRQRRTAISRTPVPSMCDQPAQEPS